MIIDTHCHIDQYPSPERVVRDCEEEKIRVVAVTSLPSHFSVTADRLRGHAFISAALGMHPLRANEGIREIQAFKRMAPYVDYIGEIGLDYSDAGSSTKNIQNRLFDHVLDAIKDRQRFITLHSRKAENEVLARLRRYNIKSAVFHWYSGSLSVLDDLLSAGYYISANPSMTTTSTGKKVLARTPRDRILVESDGPYVKVGSNPCTPSDVVNVYNYLSSSWNTSLPETMDIIRSNFSRIIEPFFRNEGEM